RGHAGAGDRRRRPRRVRSGKIVAWLPMVATYGLVEFSEGPGGAAGANAFGTNPFGEPGMHTGPDRMLGSTGSGHGGLVPYPVPKAAATATVNATSRTAKVAIDQPRRPVAARARNVCSARA